MSFSVQPLFDPKKPPVLFSVPRSTPPATPRASAVNFSQYQMSPGVPQPFQYQTIPNETIHYSHVVVSAPTPVRTPSEEFARITAPQPHPCQDCAELRRQLEDLRRENELLQVELEVARMKEDEFDPRAFMQSLKHQNKTDHDINNKLSSPAKNQLSNSRLNTKRSVR